MKHTKIAWMALLPLVWACDSKPADETATKETVVVEDASAVADNTLTEEEKASGWKLLFDGTNTDGWREFNGENFPEEGWTVEDGALKALGKGGDIGGDIVYGPEEFEEFELSWSWKISEGGNSGVLYHVVEDPKYQAPYETGPEYQMIDQLGFPEPLEIWQSIGADYAMTEPDFEGAVKPAGEWNTSRIVFSTEGSRYYLNGKQTVEFTPYSEEWTAARHSGKWNEFPDYAISKTGLISLQDHGAQTWFKNIKIRKL